MSIGIGVFTELQRRKGREEGKGGREEEGEGERKGREGVHICTCKNMYMLYTPKEAQHIISLRDTNLWQVQSSN